MCDNMSEEQRDEMKTLKKYTKLLKGCISGKEKLTPSGATSVYLLY